VIVTAGKLLSGRSCFGSLQIFNGKTVRILFVLVSALIIKVQDVAAQVPTVTVDGASDITSTNARISGSVNPNGSQTGYFVQWGTNTAYGGGGPVGSLPGQNGAVAITAMALGLSPSTTYHYRLAATNFDGTGYSVDMTLTTLAPPPPPPPPPPTVTTGPSIDVTATSATVLGTVNPNGSPTTCYFEWGNTMADGNLTPVVSLWG
jgi:hypothetical protein